jgi:hypothetical protein
MSVSPRRGQSADDLEFMTVPTDDNSSMNMNYSNRSAPAGYSGSYDSEMQSGGIWGLCTYFAPSKHPMTAFFHLLFKSAALFFYVFASWFTESYIFTFVMCIVLLACDFWTVKNVSGRLLVGLRWWSHTKSDGTNEWIFESLEDMAEISSFDSRLFWWGLYLTPLLWVLLLVLGILRLKFEYVPIILAAISMSMANIIGYMKCSSDADAKMKSMVASGIRSVGLSETSTLGWVFNGLLNMSSAGGGSSGPKRDGAQNA